MNLIFLFLLLACYSAPTANMDMGSYFITIINKDWLLLCIPYSLRAIFRPPVPVQMVRATLSFTRYSHRRGWSRT